MKPNVALFVALTLLAAASCDCESERAADVSAPEPPAGETRSSDSADPGPLAVDAEEFDFERNPDVLDRIVASRYAYFRFVALPYGQAVCDAFEDSLNVFPMVNLHGDAHVEQYAITGDASGLDDFDRATIGPAVIDLVRFGGSLALTAELEGYPERTDELLAAFLNSYRAALDDPGAESTRPSIVSRLGERYQRSPEDFLAWSETLMAPVPEQNEATIRAAATGFGAVMCEQHTELTPDYFEVQSFGRLTLGVGSGLVTKYLARIRGPSADPLDDLVIEFKEVQPGQPSCTVQVTSGGMLRPIVGDARLGRSHGRILGFVPVPPDEDNDGPTFWAKSWEAGYHEVMLSELESAEELREIASDVGHQLGVGHVRQIAEPMTPQLRRAQLDALDRSREEVMTLSSRLASAVTPAWEDLRRQVGRGETPTAD